MMRLLKLFPPVIVALSLLLKGVVFCTLLWGSTWPLLMSVDGSAAGTFFVLVTGSVALAFQAIPRLRLLPAIPLWLNALLLSALPLLGYLFHTLPAPGLGPNLLLSMLLGVVFGQLLQRGPWSNQPLFILGLALGAIILHVFPGPYLPLSWLAVLSAPLLLLPNGPYKIDKQLAHHPLLAIVCSLLAASMFWASHRLWLAFITPTRSSEGILLGSWIIGGALGSLLWPKRGVSLLFLLGAGMVAALRTLLPELPLTLGLSGILDQNSWPALMFATMGVGLLTAAPLAFIFGALLSQGKRFTGALGVAIGLSLALFVGPTLGAPALLEVLGGVMALAALVTSLFQSSGAWRYASFSLGLIALVFIGMVPTFPGKILSSALYPQLMEREGIRRSISDARSRRPLFLSEDAYGGIALFSGASAPNMVVAGVPQGGERYLNQDMAFLGVLGSLLHTDPQRALLLGPRGRLSIDVLDAIGAEVTVSALGENRLAAMEKDNKSGSSPFPKGVKTQAFGNNYTLRNSKVHFDLILSPPRSPWTREGSLYHTQNHFNLLREALRPSGLAIIALPMDTFGQSDLASVLGAFLSVFENGTVWLPPSGTRHLILLGSNNGPKQFSYLSVLSKMNSPGLRPSLSQLDLSEPNALFARLLGGPNLLAPLTEEAPLPRWDRPLFDISIPRQALDIVHPHPLTLFKDALKTPIDLVELPEPGPSTTQIKEALARSLEANKALIALLSSLGSGSFDEAVSTLLSMGPGSDREVAPLIQPYLSRARRELSLGLLDEAKAQASFARALAPHSEEPLLILAQIYLREERPALAEEAYRDALKQKPNSIQALLGAADLAQISGRFGEALNHLEMAQAQAPSSAAIYHNLGELNRVQGNLTEAEKNFEQAISLDRSLPQTHAGLALTRLAQGRPEAALPSATMALRLDKTAIGYETLGQVFLELNDYVRARSALVQCLLRDPEALRCLGGMGIVYAEEDNLTKAKETWERVLILDPDNRPARQNLDRMKSPTRGQPRLDLGEIIPNPN